MMRLSSIIMCCLVAIGQGQELFLSNAQIAHSRLDTKRPHIVFILIDDLGWAEVGWNREEKTKELNTPNMDSLVAEGIELQRHYVHKFCSPTRSSIQSGRAPIHVNVVNADPGSVNKADPVSGFAGIPRNMTGIAEVLRGGGYRTHIVGKWDVGMATPDHTPAGRGYESSLIYYHHANNCWQFHEGKCNGKQVKDLWDMSGDIPFPGRPATSLDNSASCSYIHQDPTDHGRCVYEDDLFEQRAKSIINSHNAHESLFLFWSTRTAHGTLQPPNSEYDKFKFIDNDVRRKYHAMVSWIDGAVGRVVHALKAKSMYDDTLIVMSSDNGGNVPKGNNYPLKGGKYSNWEGGIRVAAFVSGGFVPTKVRGTKQSALIAGWDWYATFAGLAGVDATDAKAAAVGLPPHDSIDQWPLLSGATTKAPRSRIEIGSNEGGDRNKQTGATRVGGVIVPPYKLVLGYGEGDSIDIAGWTGPQSPNNTDPDPKFRKFTQSCGRTPQTGCLFDIFADPTEHVNLAGQKSDVFHRLLTEVDEISKSLFSPDRGETDEAVCKKAMSQYGGFWGPWLG